MKRFLALGVVAVFAVAICVAEVDAQCAGCGSSAQVTYGTSMGHGHSGYYNSCGYNNCCYNGYTSTRPVFARRARLFTRSNACCYTNHNNCCGTGYAYNNNGWTGNMYTSGYNNCGNCGNCGNRMYTSYRRGYNCGNCYGCGGCGNMVYGGTVSGCSGCAGGGVIMQGGNQGQMIQQGEVVEPGVQQDSGNNAPPTPDDT